MRSLLHLFREVEVLRKHFGHRLHILHWCNNQNMSNALTQMDLTASQGRILGYLNHVKQPPCPKDIESTFHMSHPTVSGLLARLEKKEFIQLRPDPKDRRSKRVYLLPKAQEIFDLMDQTIDRNEQQLVKGFTQEEQELFLRLLDRAIENMTPEHCKPKEESEQHD